MYVLDIPELQTYILFPSSPPSLTESIIWFYRDLVQAPTSLTLLKTPKLTVNFFMRRTDLILHEHAPFTFGGLYFFKPN